jgi:protein-S-isoprenylcysteine O-methyltransferase Ste14
VSARLPSHLLVAAQFAGIAITLWPWYAPDGSVVLALVLGGAGGVLAIVTLAHNRIGNFSVYPEPRARARLVTSGPYAWVRHPMYSALLLLMAGVAAWYAHLANTAGVVLVLAAVLGKARREEAYLLDRFGEYDAYRQRTHGFIPYLF